MEGSTLISGRVVAATIVNGERVVTVETPDSQHVEVRPHRN
jgi:hypothetical protein